MNDDILDGMTLGSSVDDNMTVQDKDGIVKDIINRNTYEAAAMASTSPFGDAEEESSVRVKESFPVLYSIEKDGYTQIESAVAVTYEGSGGGMYAVDVDNYGIIVNDSSDRITLDSTDLKIKEKSFIKIGSGPKVKVNKNMESFFKKLELSTKMKLSHTKEVEDSDVNIADVIKTVTESEDQRKQGLIDLAEEFKSGGTSGALGDFLKTYAFQKHVLVTGPAGHGKTYMVDKFASEYGVKSIFKAFDEGTESIDLLGHMVKLKDGSFSWKDGVLTEAFRAAQTGKVMLFVDEMLRAPVKELNILVGSLSPNSKRQYQLRTGRPMEESMEKDAFIVDEEILAVPMENLFVVGTTNQGSGYNTGRIDRALKDRFRLYYQEATIDEMEDIIYDQSFTLLKKEAPAKNLTTILVSIINEITEMKETGNLPEVLSLRHVSEALDTSRSAKDVKARMLDIAPNIVSITSDGKFNDTQLSIIQDIIKAKM